MRLYKSNYMIVRHKKNRSDVVKSLMISHQVEIEPECVLVRPCYSTLGPTASHCIPHFEIYLSCTPYMFIAVAFWYL